MQTTDTMTVYERICRTRKSGRATASDYIRGLFSEFTELHGDRAYGDDHAVVGGLALLRGMPVTVIGIEKGHTIGERMERNFGCVLPEGYRKALRLMRQAEKFRRPVVCLVDTQGANCGKGAEERGAGEAIARNLYEMSGLRVPVISLMIGEGGSGGALALAVANEVWMLENAYYSVISPESCASILFKDPARAPEAAEHLCLTAQDLAQLGIIERIVPEPERFGGEEEARMMQSLRDELFAALGRLKRKSPEVLERERYEKFRRVGRYAPYDVTPLSPVRRWLSHAR